VFLVLFLSTPAKASNGRNDRNFVIWLGVYGHRPIDKTPFFVSEVLLILQANSVLIELCCIVVAPGLVEL
jgi:hypothetical protein